jgi:hypothetical protein
LLKPKKVSCIYHFFAVAGREPAKHDGTQPYRRHGSEEQNIEAEKG